MNAIKETERMTPVVREVDVLVCGAGPSGLIAAISAARNGNKTLLLERYGFMGGMATQSFVGAIHGFNAGRKRIIHGLPLEFIDRMVSLGGAINDPEITDIPHDPEIFKYVADCMVKESNIDIRLHSLCVEPVIEDNIVKGVITESKSGREAILAKIVIDATGDADIAAGAGVPYYKGRDDGKMQNMTNEFRMGGVKSLLEGGRWPTSYKEDKDAALATIYKAVDQPSLREALIKAFEKGEVPICDGLAPLHYKRYNDGEGPGPHVGPLKSTIRPGEVTVNMIRVWGDATNVDDLTRAEMEAREHVQIFAKFLKKHGEAFKDAYLIDSACQIGIRETRRIEGEYILTGEDILKNQRFPDVIALGSWHIDIHPRDPSEQQNVIPSSLDDIKDGFQPGTYYHIPYRCLVPLKMDNLLVVGRCISGDHVAQGSYRVMATCMAMGQAAGTAAGMCLDEGKSPRNLDGIKLNAKLKKQGACLE